ncbi:xanthine dehydrogenase family protein molybdopterin-binding subunit [Tolypothrix sp. VBCCA 56010]|uniref:xanthine dehydrogenase family protein molybdopterin-binding subunit n=1 Tax=Tolypothrix sp. VBCCA 56010 TaxID=3137731 RepID=UPI003D7E4E21
MKPPALPRGNAETAFANALTQHEAEYAAPSEHHNPIESFATTVVWEDDGKITVYDKTQGAPNVHDYICHVFSLDKHDVRVLSPFVGGAFGSGLRPQYQVFLAVMAARELKRSVRVSLTRQQMFTFGHCPTTVQKLSLGAANGTLEAVMHEAIAETSQFEDKERKRRQLVGSVLYHCENAKLTHKVAQLDLFTPIDMRAPGAAWGLYALESAMDELACKLGIDLLELRREKLRRERPKRKQTVFK